MLVTLDIDFQVVVYFWSWYLYVDLVWDISIGINVLSILIISSSWVVCVTFEVVFAIRIPCLGLFYDLIICVWIVHYLSCTIGVRAWLGDHVVEGSLFLPFGCPLDWQILDAPWYSGTIIILPLILKTSIHLMYLCIMCFEIIRDIVLYVDVLVSIFTYPVTCEVDVMH